MMHLVVEAAEKSSSIGLFGKLHPAVVHFPIALISVAALFEFVQMIRKRREPAGGTLPLVGLAAVSAVVASLFGWALEEYDGVEGSTFNLHKWVGIGATVVSVVAALTALKAKSSGGALIVMRLALFLGAALVGGTGYLGGELVFGENHIFGVFKKRPATPTPAIFTPVPKTDPKPDPLLKVDKVSFEKEIRPIIQDMCFKCHGGEKVKGKFKLNTKALAMEGGESGKAINPGKPALSKFYTMLIDPDEDVVMPPPKEKARPSKEQIERVKLWIEQGAEWPDGIEFKK
jgi:uncharacterized membrane protein